MKILIIEVNNLIKESKKTLLQKDRLFSKGAWANFRKGFKNAYRIGKNTSKTERRVIRNNFKPDASETEQMRSFQLQMRNDGRRLGRLSQLGLVGYGVYNANKNE